VVAIRGRISLQAVGSLNITTLVGLHLTAPTISSGTPAITNRYGILQEDASAINSFAGDVVTADTKAFYLGAVDTDGSWRILRSGTSLIFQSRVSSTWVQTAPVVSGVPSAEGSDRALTNTDNGKNLICAGTRIFTVNTGLISGFGCSFKGTVSFTGTATVTDVRTTGAVNPWCALCATGTDTYDIVGSKA